MCIERSTSLARFCYSSVSLIVQLVLLPIYVVVFYIIGLIAKLLIRNLTQIVL